MDTQKLQILNRMPFLFYIKGRNGEFLWCNSALEELAGCDMTGKTDFDMPWAAYAEDFIEADKTIFATGESQYIHEQVITFEGSNETYLININKWLDEFEGQPAVFGITYIIDYDG